MKESRTSLQQCILTSVVLVLISLNASAQINAARWIGYNSFTDVFPIEAAATSPAMVSNATVNYKGLVPSDDTRSAWKNENSAPVLDILKAPYESFSLSLLSSDITFDKFVMHGLVFENPATKAQLRWNVDGYNSPLGEFTIGKALSPALTSVDLSLLHSVHANNVEFRVYYFNGAGKIMHADSGRYVSPDRTAAKYASQDAFASIWVKDAVVPTIIEQFRGKASDENVLLKWQTASEQNISHFEIERSIDGETFYNVGRVNALGIATPVNKYHFTDRTAGSISEKAVFYRLWMLDNNGTSSYSEVVPVLIKKEEAAALFFPHLVKDTATFVINSTKDENVRYTIVDSKSRKIQTGRYALQQGNNTIHLLMGSLSRGLYTLQVTGENINSRLQFMK